MAGRCRGPQSPPRILFSARAGRLRRPARAERDVFGRGRASPKPSPCKRAAQEAGRNSMTDQLFAAICDPARLAALRRLALLDRPAEPSFDRLTRMAARVLRAPVALVSLVDSKRQFFASCVGVAE